MGTTWEVVNMETRGRNEKGQYSKSVVLTEVLVDGLKVPGKICSKCQCAKPLNDFRKKKGSSGGVYFVCRPCEKIYNAELNKGKGMRKTKPSREQIYQWHVIEGKSQAEIAKALGYKTSNAIYKLMKKYKIEANKPDVRKTAVMNGETVNLRKCSKCKEWKTKDNYSKDNRRPDGLFSSCKKCDRELKYLQRYGVTLKDGEVHKNKIVYLTEIVIDGEIHKAKECTMCGKVKPLTKFTFTELGLGKRKSKCFSCQNILNNNRRTKIKNGIYTLTPADWENCKKHFDFKCAYCGLEKKLAQEHFFPLFKGGEYTPKNIVPACSSCNSSKGTKDFFEWYPQHESYSSSREKKILKYLDIKDNTQQIAMF